VNNKVELGRIGEDLVCNLLNGIRFADPYTRYGDLVDSNGKIVEVKTQVRFRKENAFTVDSSASNQLNKCMTVDRLIFVEFDRSDTIRIFEAPRKEHRTYQTTTTSYGKSMALFPINEMSIIATVRDSVLARKMQSLTSGTL